ncbi:MAG: helicase C-terminal domain-containing protein [Phycisphaerales bacterium]
MPTRDQTPSANIIAKLLAPDGPVARAMRQVTGLPYEVRSQQEEMCEAVALAMQTRTHLLAEAGTGTGKSFAYLLPAALRAVVYGEVVIVSTHTISLQEQILNKDLPVIEKVLALLKESGELPPAATDDGEHRELKSVLVKGRGNYVSVRRLRLASERQEKLFSDAAAKRSLHVIEDWAQTTRDGTLSSLPPIERWGVWDKVQSDSGNCMGKKCQNYEQCFFQAARAEMENANLIICNHALFFSDLALRVQDAGFLPAYQHVILDEGHTVEETAGEHFGSSLSEGRVQHLLSGLYQPRTGKGYLTQLTLNGPDSSPIEKAIGTCTRAADVARAFFEDLEKTASRSVPDARESDARGGKKPWFSRGEGASAEGRTEPKIHRVREANIVENALTPVMRELALRLRGMRESTKEEADRYELNAFAIRAEMIASDAHTLIQQTSPASAYWIEVTGGDESAFGSGKRVTFACAPIEVAPLLKDRLFAQGYSVTLTSATLAMSGGKSESADRVAESVRDDHSVPSAASSRGFEKPSTRRVDDGMSIEEAIELERMEAERADRNLHFVAGDDDSTEQGGKAQRDAKDEPGAAETSGIETSRMRPRSHPAFAHTCKQLGCEGAACLQVASPFDYAKQVEVFVERVQVKPRSQDESQVSDSDFAFPTDANFGQSVGFGGKRGARFTPRSSASDYAYALADNIERHIRATDGGAFVLFTSFSTLNQVARVLQSKTDRLAMPLLVQGRDGSRTAILQRFREDERSVLLGAASFWQGVDVRGRGLRNVIITKLPFDPPDRPLVQARGELIQSRGGNPFMEDALPRAVLRFKQGFGRLIRSKDDHGRVVILDDRVITTRYGRAFLEALPEGVRVKRGEEE